MAFVRRVFDALVASKFAENFMGERSELRRVEFVRSARSRNEPARLFQEITVRTVEKFLEVRDVHGERVATFLIVPGLWP